MTSNKRPDPTPEEIKQRCAEIRESWNSRRPAARHDLDLDRDTGEPWTPPTISVAECVGRDLRG